MNPLFILTEGFGFQRNKASTDGNTTAGKMELFSEDSRWEQPLMGSEE